jgi:hypothetical protein
MFHSIVSLLCIAVFIEIDLAVGWNTVNLIFNPGGDHAPNQKN